MPHLFERFYRSDEHKRGGISGTGLGLALVKAIVDAHGGRVWGANASSDQQSGAVFTMVLPIE
jgi:signal transduction histidine kinase